MFAVIKNQEGRAGPEVGGQSFDDGATSELAKPQNGCNRVGNERAVIQRRKIHKPDTVGIDGQHFLRHLQG